MPSLNGGDLDARLGIADASLRPATQAQAQGGNGNGMLAGGRPAVPTPDDVAQSGVGAEEDRLDLIVQQFFHQRWQQQQQQRRQQQQQQQHQQQQKDAVKFTPEVGEDVPLNSELCLNDDDMHDDVSVLTSDTYFTNASAISETDSQLALPDVWQETDDLTFLTPPVLNRSRSSVPSLANTENNVSQFSGEEEDRPSNGGAVLVPRFEAVLSDVRSAHRRLDQTIAYRLFLAKNRPAFEAVLSEVRSGGIARDRPPRYVADDDPREAKNQLRPGFEALLSDVKSAARGRLRRQGTLSAISETNSHSREDESSQSSEDAGDDALSFLPAPQGAVQFKRSPGIGHPRRAEVRPERRSRTPPPPPLLSTPPDDDPPRPRADSAVSEQWLPSVAAAVNVEEETLYTAVADPLVLSVGGCNSTLTVSERSLLIRKGRCPMCGIQTHRVTGMFKRRYRPLSNEHVLAGRCLICNPINVVTHSLFEANSAPSRSVVAETNDEANCSRLDEGGGEAPTVAKKTATATESRYGEVTPSPSAPPPERVSAPEVGDAGDRPAPSAPPSEILLDREADAQDEPRSDDGRKKYFSESESREEVERWLLSRLPKLRERDVERYCRCLAEDGFDSVTMLEVLEEGDLDFMKTAHRRVLVKLLQPSMDHPVFAVSASRSPAQSFGMSLSSDSFGIGNSPAVELLPRDGDVLPNRQRRQTSLADITSVCQGKRIASSIDN